ncbi:MAG: HAMP domain-containing histidine kinase [Chitinophagaceae bacterium]|nr:HAMP domain-containing histidine kinase [Chitinophagaceae bacterium]
MTITVPAIHRLLTAIKTNGLSPELDDYEKRKLGIFNIMNALGLLTGLIVPLAGLFNDDQLPLLAWIVACSPALISITVLACNYYQRYELARLIYFTLYPVLTALVYAAKVDVGIELFFILYGVLSVFFLKKIINVIFSFSLSIACYLAVFVLWNQYDFVLLEQNYSFYFFNHLLAAVFIFAGLFMIKKENSRYQFSIISKNRELLKSNREIEQQKAEIAEKAVLLEKQTAELKELDGLKNKLFSIIAHDLKSPMYALRNLFQNVQQYNLPGDEVKAMIPHVITDLNYTTGLMENLLQWAKTQMQASAIRPEVIDVSALIKEVMQLLRLQAETKKVYLEMKTDAPVYVYADKGMVNLVLRNLLSNAIKFTPEEGYVFAGANPGDSFVEIFVEDTGTGMSPEVLQKINAANYYTTKGTANEAGTGLGLMLCREFLSKNGGKMFVESEPGKGSVFSFTLPCTD